MKKILPLLAFMAFLFSSCIHYDEPYASFDVSSDILEPYEVVNFYNLSTDADEFYWDFGDGYTSRSFNPEHYYDAEGTYTVSLRAHSYHGGDDIAYMTIDVYYTDLEITVAEWNPNFNTSIRVSDAEVTLYATYSDWLNFRNPIETKYTNSSGLVRFRRLEPTVYYVDVYRFDYDNSLLGQEDVSYVEVGPLYKSEINTFIAWVDYFPPEKQVRANNMRLPFLNKSAKRTYQKIEIPK